MLENFFNIFEYIIHKENVVFPAEKLATWPQGNVVALMLGFLKKRRRQR
jgi:hypothetical protein